MATKKDDDIVTALTAEQKSLLDDALKETDPLPQFVETGNVGLDLALTDGKGLPLGSSILLWAKPGCGKTTVVTDTCRRLIKKYKAKGEAFKCLYLAVESSRSLMSALGMDEYIASGDFLYIPRRLCWRQIETFYQGVLRGHDGYKDVKLIVIDSINNVLSDQNTKSSIADGDFGTRAKERYNFYSKYLPLCKEKGITSFFISQVRRKQNTLNQHEDPNKAAVSEGDMHNVDIIIKCSASNTDADASRIEEETVFGKDRVASKCVFKMDSKATDCKNRYIKGNAVSLLFEKGKCVWNYYTVKKLLEGHKLIKGSGWYSFDADLCKACGLPDVKLRREDLNEVIQEHIGELVNFLKEIGKYKVSIRETEVPVTDEDIQNAANEEEEEE